jgi:hypothetical protein
MSLVGAGSHPVGRFPTSLFVLGSPVREAAMKSPRSLQSCPTKQRSRNQSDRRNRLSHQEIVVALEEIKVL